MLDGRPRESEISMSNRVFLKIDYYRLSSLIKQGDNALGSIYPSIHLFLRPSALSRLIRLTYNLATKSNNHLYQSKVIVCVCVCSH